MIGAIIGDYVGSIYEMDNIKTTDFPFFSPFCRFTDDTVMSIAVADALMNSLDMAASLRKYGRMYPAAGYGGSFRRWLASDDAPSYGSYGNGSAMRASAAGWVAASLEEALHLAAADLGLGSVYLGSIQAVNNSFEVLYKLKLQDGFWPVLALAVGHAAEPVQPREISMDKIVTNIIE